MIYTKKQFTNVVQTDNKNLLINEHFMIIEKGGIVLFMKTSDNSFRII
jgi:hypothetical protein